MRIILTSIALFIAMFGFSCDNCSVFVNLSPSDYRNSIGIYARQRLLYGTYSNFGEMTTTRHTGHGNDMAFWGQDVTETYQTYELRGTFYIKNKWRTTVILPYVQNKQAIGGNNRYNLTGFGDPILLESFEIINQVSDSSSNWSHRLVIGLGVKVPLGKTKVSINNAIPNLDLQPGSGSWDALFSATYLGQRKFLGIQSNITVKQNGLDEFNYRYGRVLNAKTSLFADLIAGNTVFRFIAGTYAEFANFDQTLYKSENVSTTHYDTGGTIFFTNSAFQLITPKFTGTIEYQHAVGGTLNGFTQLLTKNNLTIGLAYNF